MNQIIKTPEQKQTSQMMVQTLILQAKALLIEGNFQEAESILMKTIEIAEARGFFSNRTKVEHELENLHCEHKNWTELLDRNTTLRERIEQARLKDHVREALELASIDRISFVISKKSC